METSQPWDGLTDGDASRAPYSSTEWDDMYEAIFASLGDSGVFSDYHQALMVQGTSSPLTVRPGSALVKGKWYRNDADESIPVDSPVGATRRDWIVLRSCWGDAGDCALVGPQAIRVVLKQNPDEDLTPPALTQTDDVCWEIPLALIDTTTLGVITVYDRRVLIPRGEAYEFIPPLSGYNESLTREIPVTPECLVGCTDLEVGVLLADGDRCKAFGRYVARRDTFSPFGEAPPYWYVGLRIYPIIVPEGTGAITAGSFFYWGSCGEATEHSGKESTHAGESVVENVINCLPTHLFPRVESGEVIKLVFDRRADLGSDTIGADVLFLGWVVGMIRTPVEYDAIAGAPCPDPTPGLCCTPGGGGIGGEEFFGLGDFENVDSNGWDAAKMYWEFQALGGDICSTWRIPSNYLGNKFDVKIFCKNGFANAGNWQWTVSMAFNVHGELVPPTAAYDVVWQWETVMSGVIDGLNVSDGVLDSGDPLADAEPGDLVVILVRGESGGAPAALNAGLVGMSIEWE